MLLKVCEQATPPRVTHTGDQTSHTWIEEVIIDATHTGECVCPCGRCCAVNNFSLIIYALFAASVSVIFKSRRTCEFELKEIIDFRFRSHLEKKSDANDLDQMQEFRSEL